MSYVQAFHALRSSSSAFASRHVVRASSAASRSPRALMAARCYSAGSSTAQSSQVDELRVEEKEKDEVTITRVGESSTRDNLSPV